MSHSFLPVAIETEGSLHDDEKIERQFFASLKNLASLYAIDEISVNGNPYPYNIALPYLHAAKCLKEKSPDIDLMILQDEDHAACLATMKTLNTRTTLYYVDVKILYDLLKQKRKKKAADLLLCVFSYLYQIVQIPYYRDEECYLHYCYERLGSWLEEEPEEWETEQLNENLEKIALSLRAGDMIKIRITETDHLNLFEQRLKGFTPTNDWEKKLLETCLSAFCMFNEFGMKKINDVIYDALLEQEDEERIRYEQYVSFYWDDGGWLGENIYEQVNTDLQERASIDEPIALQFFDKPQQKEMHDLYFPIKLFSLLDQLCETINSYRK